MKSTNYTSFDGERIAYRTLGEGRPVLLLHGFLANADLNWFAPGIAQAIAEAGFKVIAPDLRGHGASAAPDDAAAYPADALALDQEALLKHLDIADYDLIGYSLGARMAVRMLARGAKPRRVVLGGMGGSGITDVGARAALFEDAIANGERAADPRLAQVIQAMIAQSGLKPAAMLNVLRQQRSTTKAELAKLATPILVVSGRDDEDNGSAEELAALLPNAGAQRIPGHHRSAVAKPELRAAIIAFLTH